MAVTWSEQRGRLTVYARSGGLCEVCGRAADTFHHRVKRGQGGTWAPANGLHVCGDGTRYCHGWIEANPTHALTLGLWVPAGADPALVPAYVRPALFGRGWWLLDNEGCWTWDHARSLHPSPPPAVTRAVLALTTARLPLAEPAFGGAPY